MKKFPNYIALLLLVASCHSSWHVTESNYARYEMGEQPRDSAASLTIAPYKQKLDAQMKTVIAYNDSALSREGFEPPAGNFMMQAMEHYTKKNLPAGNYIIIVNRGGLRSNLPKGEVTLGNIFELMPFDNEIISLSLSGEQLAECISAMAAYKKLLSFHLQFQVKNDKAENIRVFGKPLDPLAEYHVVTTDYLANGGDNCSFFTKAKGELTHVKLRDAIISYCEDLTKNKEHIKAFYNGEITISK